MLVSEEKLKNFCEKRHILMVLLFGSRVKGDYREDSDLDLGILFETDDFNYIEIIKEVMDLFKGYQVDLAILNHADPVLKFEIIANYQLLYCTDQEIFISFYVNTIKQHNDIQKFLKLENLYLKNFIGGARSGIYQCDPPQVDKSN